jgi:hypothetical protein
MTIKGKVMEILKKAWLVVLGAMAVAVWMFYDVLMSPFGFFL